MFRSKQLINASLVVVSVVFSLFAAELIVRFVAPQTVGTRYADDISGITVPRRMLRGSYLVSGLWDMQMSSNRDRFRGTSEYSATPVPGTIRIATLGDSLTYGLGANDDQTYPVRLQETLQEQSPGARIEVLNAGIPGAGTGEQALYYDLWVKRFQPKIVVLGVYANDAEDDFSRGLFRIGADGEVVPRSYKEIEAEAERERAIRKMLDKIPFYDFLCSRSHLLALLRGSLSLVIGERFNRDTSEADETVIRNGLTLMRGELSWLNARVQEGGAQLVTAFFPSRDTLYPEIATPDDPYFRRLSKASSPTIAVLEELSKREGVPFLDLTGAMKKAAKASSERLYYGENDDHPNPVGYKIMADEVARFLVSHALRSTQ